MIVIYDNAGMISYDISFIGAGNVAEALCHGLKNCGHRIVSVSSREGVSAKKLAAETGAQWMKDYVFPEKCDIVILAVPDREIKIVADKIKVPKRAMLFHTAGSVPMKILGRDSHAGVLYPLQTFTKGYSPDLQKVPFFIEATDSRTLKVLNELCTTMGAKAYECDSGHRIYLHLAAVFTNNFSNFMITTGDSIASRAGFDPVLLKPLIEETMMKILRTGPSKSQTGPAIRHDTVTMNNNLELLSFSPEYQDLYKEISKLIAEYYKK